MGLDAAVLDRADTENCHHHRAFLDSATQDKTMLLPLSLDLSVLDSTNCLHAVSI